MSEASALGADRAPSAAPRQQPRSVGSSIVRISVVGVACLLANHSSFGAGLALGLLLSNGLWLLRLNFEPYEGYEDVLLNAEIDTETTTAWRNFGLWSAADRFPTACQDLARKVQEVSGMAEGHRVLDAAHGSGDSLLLWLETRALKSLTGVTQVGAHVDLARKRVGQLLPVAHCRDVHINEGDAVEFVRNSTETFDTIVCIDAAYHFGTRRDFLMAASKRLAPGGRITMADMILTNDVSFRARLGMRALCLVLGAPYANMVTRADYERTLVVDCKLRGVKFEDISDDVFGPLADYIDRRNADPLFTNVVDRKTWGGFVKFGKVLRWWSGGKVVRYVIVSADKPS